jgi:hypothetical protein
MPAITTGNQIYKHKEVYGWTRFITCNRITVGSGPSPCLAWGDFGRLLPVHTTGLPSRTGPRTMLLGRAHPSGTPPRRSCPVTFWGVPGGAHHLGLAEYRRCKQLPWFALWVIPLCIAMCVMGHIKILPWCRPFWRLYLGRRLLPGGRRLSDPEPVVEFLNMILIIIVGNVWAGCPHHCPVVGQEPGKPLGG